MIATQSYSTSDSCKHMYKDIKWYCIQTQYVPNLRSLVRQQAPDLFAVHFSGLIATVEEKGCGAEREAFNAKALDQDWTGEKEPNAIQSECLFFCWFSGHAVEFFVASVAVLSEKTSAEHSQRNPNGPRNSTQGQRRFPIRKNNSIYNATWLAEPSH